MKSFIHPQWQSILSYNHLEGFEKIWDLPKNWIDDINKRGKGWSGVSIFPLQTKSLEVQYIYIKRQQNYVRRYRPSMPVLEQEFNNIKRLHRLNIPTLTPIYFGKQKTKAGLQAILITEELQGFQSLGDWYHHWEKNGWPSYKQQTPIIQTMASIIKQLHQAGLIHGCLYPKHIFLSLANGVPEIKFIDLEKCRFWPLSKNRTIRDLSTLAYHSKGFSKTQKMRFLLAYLNKNTIDNNVRQLIHKMKKRLQRKGRA